MPPDDRIQELLDRWETWQAQGRSVTAEELCRDCPELLPEVERRIQALQAMRPLVTSGRSSCNPTFDHSAPVTGTRPATSDWIKAGAEPVPTANALQGLGRPSSCAK
jgi:hypothetical protein